MTSVGSYLFEEVLGRGITGQVYRAVQVDSGTSYAVKLLRPDLGEYPSIAKRFSAQGSVLRAVHHPHVVAVRDLVATDGQAAIVMDLVEGSNLRRVISARGALGPRGATRLAAQLLAALSAVHAAGIVHRDVKPHNVLLNADGEVRLTDFAVERLTRSVTGTAAYLAPELIRQDEATSAVDVYAAGIVLYELLTARRPFSADSDDVHPARPSGVASPLWAVLVALLAANPLDRPTAGEAALALRDMVPEVGALAVLSAGEVDGAVAANDMVAINEVFEPAEGGAPTVDAWPHQDEDPGRRWLPYPGRAAEPEPEYDLDIANAEVWDDDVAGVDGVERSHEPTPFALMPGAILVRLFNHRAVAAAGIAAVVLLATLVTVLVRPWSSAQAIVTQSYAFKPQAYATGLVVNRTWMLTGPDANLLQSTVVLSNSLATDLHTSYDEVVPKSVAARVSKLVLTPSPQRVVNADPVVRYGVNLGPRASTKITYVADVGKTTGPVTARLAQLARDQASAETAYLASTGTEAPTALDRISLGVSDLALRVGQKGTLMVSGAMSDGSPAPQALIDSIVWTSSDKRVATVSRGVVTAIGPGRSVVQAQAGSVTSQVSVKVVAPASSSQPATSIVPPYDEPYSPYSSTPHGSVLATHTTRPSSHPTTPHPTTSHPTTSHPTTPTKSTTPPPSSSTAPPSSSTAPPSSSTAPPSSSTAPPSSTTPVANGLLGPLWAFLTSI